MGQCQRRRHSSAKNKAIHKILKTRNYRRDHDQIHADLSKEDTLVKMEVDEYKPGAGQHYCVSCARYFDLKQTLDVHKATKKHKRMLKRMLENPYTHAEAQKAGK